MYPSIKELSAMSNRLSRGLVYNRFFLLCGFCEGVAKPPHLKPKFNINITKDSVISTKTRGFFYEI